MIQHVISHWRCDVEWPSDCILCCRLRHEKDHIINMRYEKERLDTVLEQEEKQIQRLAKILDIINT